MNRRSLRRLARIACPPALALGACCAVAWGLVTTPSVVGVGAAPTAARMFVFAVILLLALAVISRRVRFSPPSARAQRVSRLMAMAPALADVEVALVLVAACYAVFAVTGGTASPAYPLLYGVVAFSATFQKRVAAISAVAAALLLELASFAHGDAGVASAAFHAAFIGGAGMAHAVFLRGLVGRLRRDHVRRVNGEIQRRRESARDYRLISAALGADSRAQRSRAEEEEELAAGSVEAIRSNVFYSLSLLKRSLSARTCVLLWLDERAQRLRIKELVSDSDAVTEEASVGVAGALRAVVRDRSLISLPHTRSGQIPYYEGDQDGAIVAVPVMDGAHLRGLLCADRDDAFDEEEAALVLRSAEQIITAVRSEQVFTAVEHAKYEHERFYHASALLCRALTPDQVMETAFDAAAEIVDYDFGVITLHDPERRRHRVHSIRVASDPPMVKPDLLHNFVFRDNAGLASMVVKNRHHLPANGELRDTSTPVFTKRVPFRGAQSLIVLPLLSADEAMGTLTLASRSPQRFRRDVREMLCVIANQVAISIQNAVMYKKMETMATTDGLTGLTNHRTFQERFRDLLARAARHGHPATMLLTDVDHFKKVNDTYGHPVGDEVLRQVARVLQDSVRKIDIPARYGGEEFAVVLESTDLDGAMRLADRIRKDISELKIDTDKGVLQVTMSIGVAAFPDDGTDQALLIEHADHALYHAKQTGRNRVVSYQQFTAARAKRQAS